MSKISEKRWSYEFADVELNGKLVVNSLISYKDFNKKYSGLIKNLNNENQEMLKDLFAKKRIRESEVSFLNRDELIAFFDAIAQREGIGAEEVKAVPAAPTIRATPTSTTGGMESKYMVKIIESIDFNCKHDGEIIDSTVNGQIIVRNDGAKDRIWDIDLELSGGENTDLKEKKFHIPDLEPQEDWVKDYKIEITPEDRPPVVITQLIDTYPSDEIEPSHHFILDSESKGQEIKLKVTIENTSDSTVSNVVVSKAVTEDLKDFGVKRESRGKSRKAEEEGVHSIVWEVEKLGPGETAEVEIKAKVYPTEIKAVSTGELKIQYMLEAGTYSGLKPEYADGLSEDIFFLDRDERDEEPDVWDCQFLFQNRSEFPMRLEKFEFVAGDEDTEYETFAQEPNVIVNPGTEWASEPWDLKSEDEPTFSENVVYSVSPQIEERLSMSSTIQPLELHIISVGGIKDFSKNVLRSYRAETLDVTINATTRGVAPIDSIRLEDTIPQDFQNPDKADMTVIFEIEGKKKEIPNEDFNVAFEPDLDVEDISRERKMKIEIRDVLENVGMLTDESTLKVTYPLNAVRPAKNARYDAPVLYQGFTKPAGAVLEAYIEPEPITVVHERRRTRIGKSVRPGDEKDEYSVLLIYQNKGDGVKTGIKISDFVPTHFKILGADKAYEEKGQEDGTLLTWVLGEVAPGEEIQIIYTIHGEGADYSLKNIEARAYK